MSNGKNKGIKPLPRNKFPNPLNRVQNSPQGLRVTATQEITFSSSPLPPPEEMKKWEEVCPGAADRFMTQWENQSAHRQKQEDKVITANISNERRGQIFAFIVFMTALLGGFILIYLGLTSLGLTAIIGSLVVPAILLIFGKKANIKTLLNKREQIERAVPQSNQLQAGNEKETQT